MEGGAQVSESSPPFPRPPRRWFLRGELRAALLAVLALAVAGVPVGAIWSLVTPHVRIVITAAGPDLLTYETDAFFAGDGSFFLMGLAAGLVAGAVGWLLRRYRGPVLLAAVVLGSLVGAVVAWQVGRHAGLAHYHQLLHSTQVGRQFDKPVALRGKSVLLAQAFMAALTYLVLAVWSSRPDLRGTR